MYRIRDMGVINNLIKNNDLKILNAINIMKNEDDWDIYVDNIDNPEGFILRCGYWNIPYSPYDSVAYDMLKNVNYREEEGFSGVLYKYYEMVRDFKNIDWTEKCYLYYLDNKDLDISRVKHNVRSLRLKDAKVVNKYYTYKSNDSLDYIKDCITKRPSSAIFDSDDNPISWALVREDGTMGIMYTKKEYRSKGLAISVSVDLARKVINSGGVPFVHIVVDNIASIKLAQSIGFKRYGEIMWFGVKK